MDPFSILSPKQPAPVYYDPTVKTGVTSTTLDCLTCEAPVALLLFVPDAFTAEQLAGCASTMEQEIKALDLPTWVIGAEQTITSNESLAWVMKIGPLREKAECLPSTILNAELDHLQRQHCAIHC